MPNKDIETLIKTLRKRGIRVERTTKHYKVYAPDKTVVFMPKSPSDKRSYANVLKKLKHHDLDMKKV